MIENDESEFEIIHVDVPEDYLEILKFTKQEFYRDGDESPMIMGGAISSLVYNQFVRKPHQAEVTYNDIDIFINLPFTTLVNEEILKKEYPMDFVGRQLFDIMEEHSELENFTINQHVYRFIKCGIATATRNNKKLEFICLERQNTKPEELVVAYTTFPFDGFSMDINGTVYAEKDAMSHLANGIYRIDGDSDCEVEYGLKRFYKKRQQYPHLRAILPPDFEISEEYKDAILPPNHPMHKRFGDRFWIHRKTPDGKYYQVSEGLRPI